MAWKLTSDTPIYLQAAERIKLRILTGEYPPGGAVPSVRELAQEAAVNPNTMQKALALLESEGLLTTYRTAGRRVTERAELIRCLRLDMAHSHIETCKQNLKALGFSEEEIQTMMSASEKE